MSYFDHVRCTACKATIDPESIAQRPGQGMSCPRCGAPLSLTDLFGLKDAFQEEEQEDPSFDELVPASRAPQRPPAGAHPPSGRAPAASPARPPAKALPAPSRPAPPTSGTARVAPSAAARPEPEPDTSSALAAMRALKRKK